MVKNYCGLIGITLKYLLFYLFVFLFANLTLTPACVHSISSMRFWQENHIIAKEFFISINSTSVLFLCYRIMYFVWIYYVQWSNSIFKLCILAALITASGQKLLWSLKGGPTRWAGVGNLSRAEHMHSNYFLSGKAPLSLREQLHLVLLIGCSICKHICKANK